MNKNTAIFFAVLVLVAAGLVYWILGGSGTVAAPSMPTVSAPAPSPAPYQPAPVVADNSPTPAPTPAQPPADSPHRVVSPTMPAVAQPVAAPAATAQPTPVALTPEQRKSVTNNLRQLAAASQQYMLDKGVTQATYYDLVGDGTDNYLHNIAPVADEDYTGIVVAQTTTQMEVDTPGGDSVTFNL